MTHLQRFVQALYRVEDILLTAVFMLMLSVCVLQIAARNLNFTGLAWGDDLVRVLVLWVGLLGAMAAARTDKHLRIDLLTRLVGVKMRKWLICLTQAGTAAVSGVAAYASVTYIQLEYADGLIAFWVVPVWASMLIIPVALGVIGLRYTVLSLQTLICPAEHVV